MKTNNMYILTSLLDRTSRLRKICCLGFLTLLTHSAALAASTTVDIQQFSFSPNSVTINVEDSVIWNWVSDFHNTVSATGLWSSQVMNTGARFTNTFHSAGSFPYSCTVHFFTGTVNVESGNTPPAVAITSPTNGAF